MTTWFCVVYLFFSRCPSRTLLLSRGWWVGKFDRHLPSMFMGVILPKFRCRNSTLFPVHLICITMNTSLHTSTDVRGAFRHISTNIALQIKIRNMLFIQLTIFSWRFLILIQIASANHYRNNAIFATISKEHFSTRHS